MTILLLLVGAPLAGGALVLIGWLLGQRDLGEAFSVGLVFILFVLAAYGIGNWLGLRGWLGHLALLLGAVVAVATLVDSSRNGLRRWRDRRYLGA